VRTCWERKRSCASATRALPLRGLLDVRKSMSPPRCGGLADACSMASVSVERGVGVS
jgi:hypothetical protein